MAAPKIAGLTSIQLDGLEELQQMLGEIAPNQARNILRGSVFGIARNIRDRMRTRVKKDSHAVEKSIYAVRRRGKPNFPIAEVRLRGTPHSHALMLEFGTSKTKAQPYITPSVEESRPGIPGYMREDFGKRLEKALEKQAKKK